MTLPTLWNANSCQGTEERNGLTIDLLDYKSFKIKLTLLFRLNNLSS